MFRQKFRHLVIISVNLYYTEKFEHSFIPTVRPTVHTNPSQKRSSSNRRDLKTVVLCFRVDGKQFENEHFENDARRRH